MPPTDPSIGPVRATGGRYEKADGGGLYLVVLATRAKVFCFSYRFGPDAAKTGGSRLIIQKDIFTP